MLVHDTDSLGISIHSREEFIRWKQRMIDKKEAAALNVAQVLHARPTMSNAYTIVADSKAAKRSFNIVQDAVEA
jgi:alkyl hydroperoxide reductase subunit AhpC